MEKIKLDYSKMVHKIGNAILDTNENEFKGMVYIQQGIRLREERVDKMIRIKLDSMASQVLDELKEELGDQLVIIQDGEEI